MSRETVIVGAGPAGLAAARCLGRRGRDYLLLEQGDRVAAGLRTLDPRMTLVSPTPLSRLPGMGDLAGEKPYLEIGRYLELLESYREENGIAAELGARVLAVERGKSGGFLVRYRDGAGGENEVQARYVLNASGVVSWPVWPQDFDPATTTITFCHSREARREQLAAARRLLVIGGGISADDVIADWLLVRQPGEKAYVSLRSPLRHAPKRVLGIDVHYWVWLPEHLPILPGVWKPFRRNPILGGALLPALRSGEVVRLPPVEAYREDRVELHGGEVFEPDLMVFATGFRYATPHLGDLFSWPPGERPRARRNESLDAPGLFLLGLHFARNYASPYLRGIAADADYVAEEIARREQG